MASFTWRSIFKGLVLIFAWNLLLAVSDSSATLAQPKASLDEKFYRAIFEHAQGNYDLAFYELIEALEISRQSKSDYYEGRCLLWLGITSWDIGNIQGSFGYFNKATKIFVQIGDKIAQEFCLRCRLIVELYLKGKADRDAQLNYSSLNSFEQGILLGRELGIPDFEQKLLRQKGLTYWQLGEFTLFFECNQRGLGIAEKINHTIEKGRCLNNIGVYYQNNNDYSLALAHFERAISQLDNVNDLTTRAECLCNLGVLYRDIGYHEKALDYFSKALKLDKLRADDNSVLINLENIGSTYLRRGLDNNNKQDLLRASDIFYSCFSLWAGNKASPILGMSLLNNIGISECEIRNFINAREKYIKALEYAKKEKCLLEECYILNNLGSSYFIEAKIDLALIYYRKAFALGLNNSIDSAVLESCLGLGQCYEALRLPQEAMGFYMRAVEILEKIRGRISSEYIRIGFTKNKMNVYRRIIRILSEVYFEKPSITLLDEIFKYIEKAKARAFVESIIEMRRSTKLTESQDFKEKEQAISIRIQAINNTLVQANLSKDEREDKKLRLREEEERYLELISETRGHIGPLDSKVFSDVLDISRVRRNITNKHTALLEYFLCEDQSYLIYISRRESKLFKLSSRNEISSSVRALLKMLESPRWDNGAGIEASKRVLREIMPLAVRSDLRDVETLIIIPDGILYYLPFEALPSIQEGPFSYLVEDLAISYCPSVSSLHILMNPPEHKVPPKGLLAVGGVIYQNENPQNGESRQISRKTELERYDVKSFDFAPLPFSIEEVFEISNQFPINKRKILIGENASEETIKSLPLDSFRFIHFACHGFHDYMYPLRSSLILTNNDNKKDDGFLQAREIYGLDIRADLVVLSACQTGSGLMETVEGPIGLMRPFFYAGARSVISSLWQINDKASVLFMKEFYRHLSHGNFTTKALQLTKKRMLRSIYSSPFYWAGLILSGDPAAVSTGL